MSSKRPDAQAKSAASGAEADKKLSAIALMKVAEGAQRQATQAARDTQKILDLLASPGEGPIVQILSDLVAALEGQRASLATIDARLAQIEDRLSRSPG